MSPEESAAKEALEEAGLKGQIVGGSLGEYIYRKQGQRLKVVVMLMEVDFALDHWHEAKERQRRWVSPQEAETLLDRPALRQLLTEAVRRLTFTDKQHSA